MREDFEEDVIWGLMVAWKKGTFLVGRIALA